MERFHVHIVAGIALVIVGALLIVLMAPSGDLVVDHHQEFLLEASDGFKAGVHSANESAFEGFLDYPIFTKVGEFYLDEGAHSVWIERLEGPDSMRDVVSLHLDDEEGFVGYFNPPQRWVVERSGVEYELLFIVDVDTPGMHSIETWLLDDDYEGEELDIMVTHEAQEDMNGVLIGLMVLLSGLSVLIASLLRLRAASPHPLRR